GNVWDQHSNLYNGHEKNSLATDQPVAALLADLKSGHHNEPVTEPCVRINYSVITHVPP
ncbi:MAG: DUF1501 domain-containing protein, partial [Fuerstiella sp.]|nr:DUF1501 domain-containing protein [Fuerstiella sp.]